MNNQYHQPMPVSLVQQFYQPNHHCQVGGLEQPFAYPVVGLPKAEPNDFQQNAQFANFHALGNHNRRYFQSMDNQLSGAPIDHFQNLAIGFSQPMSRISGNEQNGARIAHLTNTGLSQSMANQQNGAYFQNPGFSQSMANQQNGADFQNPGFSKPMANQQNGALIDNVPNTGFSQSMANQLNGADFQNPGSSQSMANQQNGAYFQNPGFSQSMANQQNGADFQNPGFSQPMANQQNGALIDHFPNTGFSQPMANRQNDALIDVFQNPGFSQPMANQQNGAQIEPLQPWYWEHNTDWKFKEMPGQKSGFTSASYDQQRWNYPSGQNLVYNWHGQPPSQQPTMSQKPTIADVTPMIDHMPITADLHSMTDQHAYNEQEDAKNTQRQQPSTSGACSHPKIEYDAQALEHDDKRSAASISSKRKMMDVSRDHPSDSDDIIPEVSASPKKSKVIRKLRPRKVGVQYNDEKDEIIDSDDETMHATKRNPLKQTQKPQKKEKDAEDTQRQQLSTSCASPHPSIDYDAQALEHDDTHFEASISTKREILDVSHDHSSDSYGIIPETSLSSKKPTVIRKLRPRKMGVQYSDEIDEMIDSDDKKMHAAERNPLKSTQKQKQEHHKSKHGKIKIQPVNGSFDCTVCGKRLKNRQTYRNHMDIHKDTTYECRYCNRSFHHKSTQYSHYRHCSKVPEEDKAQGIGKTYTYKRKPHHHECNECKKTFTTLRNYQNHVDFHKGKFKHECELCQKKFNYTPHYTDHMNRHNRVRKFECEKCGCKFPEKFDLNRHNRTYGGKCAGKCKGNCKKSNLKKHNRIHGGKCRENCNTDALVKVEKST